MKPTKSRVFCNDCGRQKMLFETEKKADKFIEFNSAEIESESGYSPNRSYFCIACNGWHVSSKEAVSNKSRTEYVLDLFKEEKEKKAAWRAKKAQLKKQRNEALSIQLKRIEDYIKILEKLDKVNENFPATLNLALEEFAIAKNSPTSPRL